MQLVAQACYPNPQNITVRVYRGWPVPAQLDLDLVAGVVNVSVYASNAESKTTRHLAQWEELPPEPVTLTLTVSGNAVTRRRHALPRQRLRGRGRPVLRIHRRAE